MEMDIKSLHFSAKQIAEELLSHKDKVWDWKVQGVIPAVANLGPNYLCYGLALLVETKRYYGQVSIILDERKALFNIYLVDYKEGSLIEKDCRRRIPLHRIVNTISSLIE